MSLIHTVRRSPVLLAAILVVALAGAYLAWWLGSPLFIRTTLVETTAADGQPLFRGQFNEIDSVHRGAGSALIVRHADGTASLRFEQFQVTNGPDLRVFLSKHASPKTSEDVHQGAVEVGELKASQGEFSYELGQRPDLGEFKSVVIYCAPFRVIFSFATLGPA